MLALPTHAPRRTPHSNSTTAPLKHGNNRFVFFDRAASRAKLMIEKSIYVIIFGCDLDEKAEF
jgi:hypothetical protein